MDTREVATEYRLAQWAQTIQARVKSGHSIKDFCISSGISRNAYFYWQRKLREVACSEIQEMATQVKAEDSLVPSGWARLESQKPNRSEKGVTIEIGGCRVNVTAETDPDLLAKVCRVLIAL